MAKVVLGVSASVAAYKAADLASQLTKAGIEVYPVLTVDATRFVSPATFAAITGNPCPVGIFDEPFPGEIAHIHLARLADAFVIAPATANVMARLAGGVANDMLSAAVLATSAPVLLAPAMNTGMWENPATQANLARLRDFGYYFVEPICGRLACRTEGVGKLADAATIYEAVLDLLKVRGSLVGKKVLITAGPTREPIDPVRFISNRSSGKMGYAVAAAAARRGASVTLVSGPVSLPAPAGADVLRVETAAEMERAVCANAATADILIASAAVADWRPATASAEKGKKDASRTLDLTATTDILARMGAEKKPGQVLVGFAAETGDLIENARKKLGAKNLDWIVANDVTREGAGFDVDTNIVTLLSRSGERIDLPLMSKREVAEKILDAVSARNDNNQE